MATTSISLHRAQARQAFSSFRSGENNFDYAMKPWREWLLYPAPAIQCWFAQRKDQPDGLIKVFNGFSLAAVKAVLKEEAK